MKKQLILCICTFTLIIFLPCTVGFANILKDLQQFEKSLGDWVAQIDELNNKISKLEKENESKNKQIADYNQSLANIENLLTNLDAKVERVENMSSLEGVKNIVKSFEGTLNVFKKRFSELANRLEDQEVKTAVLEKMYKTANQPLDTLMQALDEQKSIIGKLQDKLGNQEQIILSMKDTLQKQTSSEGSLALGIEDLNVRLSELESGVLVQKATEQKAHPEEHHEEQEQEHTSAHGEHDEIAHEGQEHVVAQGEHHEAAHEGQEHVSAPEEHKKGEEAHAKTDLIDIGEGFFVKNIHFKSFGSSSQMKGIIMNKSDRDYGMLDFKVQTYNRENTPLGGHGFSVHGFGKGVTKAFEEIIVGVEPEKIIKYAIYPARAPLVSGDSGERTIRIIEKELAVAQAEVKEETPEKLEDIIFDEGSHEAKAAADAKAPEGFEDAGNEFYAGNVSFDTFGSSSRVTGKIKNHSKKDYYNASFVLRIYSKSYGMLTSFDFSVRRINSGDTKPFEEIITGVNPVDIDRYEIAFKSAY